MADGSSTPPPEDIVLYDKDPATKIATITLDRAADLNAMTIEATHRYAELIRNASYDDDVKVLVIRANGPNLGTGADLPEMMAVMARKGPFDMNHAVRIPEDAEVNYPPGGTYRYGASNVHSYLEAGAGIRSLQEFKKISILEVRGYCYGWHFYQAADADLVISSDDALFGHAAFRYVGWGARQWQWAEMMGVRKFMEMVFTGRPFTAKEMADCNFINAVVPFDQLEDITEKYALACANASSSDTIFAQKMFFEAYKQHKGEYLGSILTGWLETMGRQMKPDPETMTLDKETLDKGLSNTVRDNDDKFPPEWRLSRKGRGEE